MNALQCYFQALRKWYLELIISLERLLSPRLSPTLAMRGPPFKRPREIKLVTHSPARLYLLWHLEIKEVHLLDVSCKAKHKSVGVKSSYLRPAACKETPRRDIHTCSLLICQAFALCGASILSGWHQNQLSTFFWVLDLRMKA